MNPEELDKLRNVGELATHLLYKYLDEKKAAGADIDGLNKEWRMYKEKIAELERKSAEESERRRNEELDYFCGRHTFYPYEL